MFGERLGDKFGGIGRIGRRFGTGSDGLGLGIALGISFGITLGGIGRMGILLGDSLGAGR